MEGYNVNTVLKRLEAAASRLEDVVMFAEARSVAKSEVLDTSADSNVENNKHSNSVLVSPKSSAPMVALNAPPLPPVPKSQSESGITALQSLHDNKVIQFTKLSESITLGVGKQAQAFANAFAEMIEVVKLAGRREKTDMPEFVNILQPMNTAAAQVEVIRDEYRNERELANFFSTLPAGVGALGWVSIDGQQASGFVQEMKDSAQFYSNRVLKDRKDAKPWVNSYIGILDDLMKLVKEYYPDGLQWTASGAAAAFPPQAATSESVSPSSEAITPPPPPPPPPSVEQLNFASSSIEAPQAGNASAASAAGGLSGVFAELNQGESIASGLKKTDKAALKSVKPPISKSTKPKPGAAPASSTNVSTNLKPRLELIESKWHVEDLESRHDIEIAATMGQSVQIDNCKDCTIKITGKAATFNLSRCSKVGLLVENMVASCDIVNCSDFGLQVTGSLPSLMIDQSHQGSIYLSHESLGLDIFTSQTTTINVNVPENEPGAYRELPLGEQIVHHLVKGNFEGSVVKHA